MRAIDLFAGAGGFTLGAQAAGLDVVWAANHWPLAVDIHGTNHPDVEHSCQDLMQADWSTVPEHDVLLASPACQGHSQAGQPGRARCGVAKHERDRNTAWAVIGAADACRPRRIVVENVVDFRRWVLYRPWIACLEALGYAVREHAFDCADWGVPQNRQRLIVTAGLDGPVEISNPQLAHQGFGDCVDWDGGRWAPIRTKTPGVQARIQAGRDRGLGDRFLTHHVSGHRGRELSRPIGCITTKDQWAVVSGGDVRMLTAREYGRAMTFPEHYLMDTTKTNAVRLLGNAIPPAFAEQICRQVKEAA